MLGGMSRLFKGRAEHSKEDSPLRVPKEIELLNSYSMSGVRVLKRLYSLGREVAVRNITGDFVECGVCNGGSAAAIACALRGTKRRIWLYDSFEGLLEPKEIDGPIAPNYAGHCVGSERNVRQAMQIARFPDQDYTIQKGWFQDTFRASLPQSVALLHIDADWYESVMVSLQTFYDLIPPGGIIVLDDFGCWEGCRKAFYDFVAQRQINPLVERFGLYQACWIKERRCNRDFRGHWQIPPLNILDI